MFFSVCTHYQRQNLTGAQYWILDTLAPGEIGTRALRHLCETFRYQDKLALNHVCFGKRSRSCGQYCYTVYNCCLTLWNWKKFFCPIHLYHVSGLLLKIFSIWLAHVLGSGMDSKNNKNPNTVIFFSLYV
jgi:hypothetical protein